MNKSERIAEMAREISAINEWNRTNLRRESFFNWQSLILFIALMLLPVGVYILSK